MLEQSQQDFTISYFCRLILLHNLTDWQSATEEQKLCWTREGIFLSHITLLLTVTAHTFSVRAPQKHGRRQRRSITVSSELSLCPAAEWLMPLPLLLSWGTEMCSSSSYLPTFQIIIGCAFIHSNCLDFLFFFFFFFPDGNYLERNPPVIEKAATCGTVLGLLGKKRPREHRLFILHYSTFFQTCFYITWQVITSCLWLQMGRTANNQMQIKNSLEQTHHCIVMASLLLTPLVKALPRFGCLDGVAGWRWSVWEDGPAPAEHTLSSGDVSYDKEFLVTSWAAWRERCARAGMAPTEFYNPAKIGWANPTRIINSEAWPYSDQDFSFLPFPVVRCVSEMQLLTPRKLDAHTDCD